MRLYELVFVVDPRTSDEEVVQLTDEIQKQIEAADATVAKTESWGRRKLAYPINKIKEGKYVLLYITAEEGNPLAAIETRLNQNEKVLRHLVVRTDRFVEIEPDEEAAAEEAAAAEAAAQEPAAEAATAEEPAAQEPADQEEAAAEPAEAAAEEG